MPSKNIIDIANQIKTYMRGAEVVASKNLFNPNGFYTPKTTTVNGGTVTNNGDGSYTINGTITSSSDLFITQSSNGNNYPQSYLLSDYSSLIKMGNIASMDMSTPVSGCYFRLNMRDSSDAFVQDIDASDPTSITIPQNATKFRLKIWIPAGTYNDFTVYPMITDASETDQTYKPYFEPLKDSKLDIADQQVLGAWNLWDNTITLSNNSGGTNTKTSDGYDIQCTTTNYSGSYFDRATVRSKYTQYGTIRLSFEYKSDTACSAQVGASPHINSGTLPTTWTKYDEVFDASTIDHIVFYNRDTTKAPKISIRNIMISLPTSANLPYVAPTMTNRELTDKVQGIINAATNAADFAAFKTAIGNL